MDYLVTLPQFGTLALVGLPLAAAAVVALAGATGRNPRRLALWLAVLHLGLTGVLAALAAFDLTDRSAVVRDAFAAPTHDPRFTPVGVPGDPGIDGRADTPSGETAWAVLPLGAAAPAGGPPPDVQLYLGLDGLNVWLVALASLMTVVAVLVSWDSATDRPGGYYAWVLALLGVVTGAFLAFDVVVFYVFFELTLVPAFFLIGSWGVGGGRRDAARKFFLYTLFGGLFTLTGVVGIVLTNPTPLHPLGASARAHYGVVQTEAGEVLYPKEGPVTFSIPRLMRNVEVWAEADALRVALARKKLDAAVAARDARRPAPDDLDAAARRAADELTAAEAARAKRLAVQAWLFVALMVGFAVKVPIVPLHTWLPAAYAEAPAAVTMLLSAVLAKLGAFGILRVVIPLAPDAAVAYGLPVFGTLGAVGVVYAALCAFAQRDAKLLAAYSSVSHLGFLVLGLFALNREGVTGAALHMVNHGLATGALFAALGVLAHRYRTLDMSQYGGLFARFPGYSVLVVVICLAGIGLPGLNNFVSEMLMLAGVLAPANAKPFGYGLGVVAAAGIFLSAWYTMTMLRRMFFGPPHEPPTADGPAAGLTRVEAFALGVPAALCLALGVFPQPVLETMTADAAVVTSVADRARRRAGLDADPVRRSVGLPPPPPGASPEMMRAMGVGGPGVIQMGVGGPGAPKGQKK